MTVYDVALIPLIVAVVQMLKVVGLPVKFAALAAVGLGILLGVVYIAPQDILQGLLVGASVGLSASGLYSSTKNTIEGIKKV